MCFSLLWSLKFPVIMCLICTHFYSFIVASVLFVTFEYVFALYFVVGCVTVKSSFLSIWNNKLHDTLLNLIRKPLTINNYFLVYSVVLRKWLRKKRRQVKHMMDELIGKQSHVGRLNSLLSLFCKF